MGFAIGKLRVDVASHADHRASDVLVGIIIAREIALHVAKGAHHTQTGVERDHGRLKTFRGENFEILGGGKRTGPLLLFFLSGNCQRHHYRE